MDPFKKRSATQANLTMTSRPTKRKTAVSAPSNVSPAHKQAVNSVSMLFSDAFGLISKAFVTSEPPIHLSNPSTRSLPGSFVVSPQQTSSKNVDDHEDRLEDEDEEESTLDSYAENDYDNSDDFTQTQDSLEATSVPSTPILSVATSPIALAHTPRYSSALSSQRTTPISISRHRGGHHQSVARSTWKNHVHPLKKQYDIDRRMARAQELYNLKRSLGYAQDISTFRAYLSYKEHMERFYAAIDKNMPSPKPATGPESLPKMPSNSWLQRAVIDARKSLESPRPFIPRFKTSELLAQQNRERDAEIERRLRPKLPDSLPPEDEQKVKQSLSNRSLLVKVAREQVTAQDLGRLRPGQWLNDEIINFYGALITERAAKFEAGVKNGEMNGKGKGRASDAYPEMEGLGEPWKVHFFNTFFLSKLQDMGYEKARLNKWTKKMDIFSKDIVLIPCNLGNAHWTCAAINFRDKRIEYYDSMGMDRPSIRAALRTYLDKEHQDKKSKPFNFEGWTDLFGHDGPQQENGFDCGVFVCQTMENLSRGVSLPFDFTQRNMPYLRRRMILEITTQQLPIKRL